MYFKAESMLRTDNRRNQKPENKRFIVIFETFYKKIVTFKSQSLFIARQIGALTSL